MNCKWYQEEVEFKASGSCGNPVTKRDEVLGRKVADRTCKSCEVSGLITIPLIIAVVAIPIFVAFKSVQ